MCDTLVRVTDDAVLFAKNSDRDPNELQLLEHHPAADHEPGRLRVTHTDIDQVAHTHAVLISRPWWLWGAEMGANEHGVVIGNEAVFTRGVPAAGGQLTGMDLLRLALERSRDRAEAVEVIVSLLERHGQGGAASHVHPRFTYDSSYLVADRVGATVLETAGRTWVTEEVSGARSISNGLTIPGFADRHADRVRGAVGRCTARRSRTTASAGRSREVLDLMAALRDHGPGPDPAYGLASGALGAPCAHAGGVLTSTQTTASWVSDVSAGRHWATGTSAPCTSIFRPLPMGSSPCPEPAGGDDHHDPDHLWWRHEQVHRAWVRDPAPFAEAAARRDALERRWVEEDVPVEQAWQEAAGWEEAAARVAAGGARGSADRRPPLVRALWRRWDRQAGVPA